MMLEFGGLSDGGSSRDNNMQQSSVSEKIYLKPSQLANHRVKIMWSPCRGLFEYVGKEIRKPLDDRQCADVVVTHCCFLNTYPTAAALFWVYILDSELENIGVWCAKYKRLAVSQSGKPSLQQQQTGNPEDRGI
jgi:hypothetical protein